MFDFGSNLSNSVVDSTRYVYNVRARFEPVTVHPAWKSSSKEMAFDQEIHISYGGMWFDLLLGSMSYAASIENIAFHNTWRRDVNCQKHNCDCFIVMSRTRFDVYIRESTVRVSVRVFIS